MPYEDPKNKDLYQTKNEHKAGETNVKATYEYTSGNPTPESRKANKKNTHD